MQKWLRAVNPLMTSRGMAEAQWSAQSMAIALAISFLGGLPGSIWLLLNPDWFTSLLIAQQGTNGLDVEDLGLAGPLFETAMQIMFGVSFLITAIVYGVLALVQWRYRTRWIPIVWLAFVAYGLLMMLVRQVSGVSGTLTVGPPWMYGLSLVCSMAATVIAVSSLRGALLLHRLRREP